MLRRVIADVMFARGHFALAARLASSNPAYFEAAARAASRAGDADTAARYCERAVALDYQLEPVHDLLTSLFLHGELYDEVLGRIHRHLQPRTYVEIGVETGASLRRVSPQTQAIGIDPEPALRFAPPANVRIFRETSDDFFARHDVRELFGGLPVELAFIDGMHHFEFALRDFMNVERCCAPGSTILIDDCFPHDRRTAERKRFIRFWNGDVWKLLVLLKKHRPDLAIHTVAAPPAGLTIVRNLDPSSRFIADHLPRLVEEFMALDHSYLERDRATKLNLFPNDWEKIQTLLPRQL